jgi:hypothetical protein
MELTNELEACNRATEGVARIFLFIDGLDEFGGTEDNRSKLVDLLKTISASENVKVCVSSRPWLTFEEGFEGCPSILVEEINRHDILMYVEDLIGFNSHFRRLKETRYQDCNELISEIVRKSQGYSFGSFWWLSFC